MKKFNVSFCNRAIYYIIFNNLNIISELLHFACLRTANDELFIVSLTISSIELIIDEFLIFTMFGSELTIDDIFCGCVSRRFILNELFRADVSRCCTDALIWSRMRSSCSGSRRSAVLITSI